MCYTSGSLDQPMALGVRVGALTGATFVGSLWALKALLTNLPPQVYWTLPAPAAVTVLTVIVVLIIVLAVSALAFMFMLIFGGDYG